MLALLRVIRKFQLLTDSTYKTLKVRVHPDDMLYDEQLKPTHFSISYISCEDQVGSRCKVMRNL